MKTKIDAAYMRYSSTNQDGGCSIELQREAIRRQANTVTEYIDRAKSGRKMAGRHSLLRLLDDAAAGGIERLWLYKYDRLGRNLAETSTVIAQLEEYGVHVISVTEGEDSLVRGIMMSVSEHYSKQLGERCRAGMAERFRQGYWVSSAIPLGYKTEREEETGLSRLVIDPDEAPHVQEIFRLYTTQGCGLYKIARMLDERGIATHGHYGTRKWCNSSTAKILDNTTYIGICTWGKRGGGEIVEIERPELRIIDQTTWDETRRIRRERSKRQPGYSGKITATTGLVRCEVCGGQVFHKKISRARGGHPYLACGTRLRHGAKSGVCSNSSYVRVDHLMTRVQEVFRGLIDGTEGLIDEAMTETRRLVDINTQRLNAATKRRGTLTTEIDKLGQHLLDGEFDAVGMRALRRQISKREAEIEEIDREIEIIASESTITADRLEQAVRQAFDEVRESLADVTTPEQMRQFMARFVGPMILTADARIIRDDEGADSPHISMINTTGRRRPP